MGSIRFCILAFAVALSPVALTGCSTNLTRFDVIAKQKNSATKMLITRAETADQGSGTGDSTIVGPGGHTLSRITIGGSYLRRSNTTAGGHTLVGGLHGNPQASE
jgi:hypothetical protein